MEMIKTVLSGICNGESKSTFESSDGSESIGKRPPGRPKTTWEDTQLMGVPIDPEFLYEN